MQTYLPRREGWLRLKVKRRKLPKHPSSSFFSGNEQLKIMILYIPILLLFLHIKVAFLKIYINKKQRRKMCMTEIKNRDSLTDKPRETSWTRLAEKRVNYEMDRWTTRTFKHLLKIIKISHIPLNISTFCRSTQWPTKNTSVTWE